MTEPETSTAQSEVADDETHYLPLTDTLRLYGGWLLGWYGIVYLLGWFQHTGRLPFSFDFIESLFQSALVLNFAFGTYLFLLLTSVHRVLGGGVWLGILLFLVGIALQVLFMANV